METNDNILDAARAVGAFLITGVLWWVFRGHEFEDVRFFLLFIVIYKFVTSTWEEVTEMRAARKKDR
jgi:hypothetical protein